MSEPEEGRPGFLRKVWLVVGTLLLVGAVTLFLWKALGVALMIFGGVLAGIALHGMADALRRRSPLSYHLSLLVVGVALAVVLGGFFFLLGPAAVEQLGRLAERLPGAAADVESWLREFWLGRLFLSTLDGSADNGGAEALLGRATGLFRATLGAFVTVAVIAFLGTYFAVAPGTYRRALVWLVPPPWRPRTEEILGALASALRSWILGRVGAMLAVSLLTGVGLAILGVPLVLGLALLAGLLNFVPIIGPIASAVPAVLIAWGESGGVGFAAWVALFYLGVQTVESFAITPYIQREAVSIPPAVLVSSQILMGMAAGVLGILFATPLAVVAGVLVQTLYGEDVLHEEVDVWGS